MLSILLLLGAICPALGAAVPTMFRRGTYFPSLPEAFNEVLNTQQQTSPLLSWKHSTASLNLRLHPIAMQTTIRLLLAHRCTAIQAFVLLSGQPILKLSNHFGGLSRLFFRTDKRRF
jgi:hypothetical protein